MSISLEELQSQLASTEIELEHAKSHVSRCDGAIQLLKHFIKEAQSAQAKEEQAT